MFHFFTFFNCRTIRIGVTDVFSFLNRFHFEYQYTLPCAKRNSKRKNENQNEQSEYNRNWGYALFSKKLTIIKPKKAIDSPVNKYESLFSNLNFKFTTSLVSLSHQFNKAVPLFSLFHI